MILLKKPYTPVVFVSATKMFNVYGSGFRRIEAIYLSGDSYDNQTFFNPFSSNTKLSATYQGFTGVKLLTSQYTTNFINTISITLPPPLRSGYIDIIVQNPAGYGVLTQCVIKDLHYSDTIQTQKQLRPWSGGIQVLLSSTQ